jgi:hypothetical protein
VSLAAQRVGISRQHVYWCRERDPRFAAAMQHALEEATDRLELKARKMAMEGDPRTLLALLRWHRYGPRVATPDRPAIAPAVRHELGDDLREFMGSLAAVMAEQSRRVQVIEGTTQILPPEAQQ